MDTPEAAEMKSPIAAHIYFALQHGMTFQVVCRTAHLEGIPSHVRKDYPDMIQLRFDAEFHSQSVCEIDDHRMDVILGFDKPYEVTIPIVGIIAYFVSQEVDPVKAAEAAEAAGDGPGDDPPHLRLV